MVNSPTRSPVQRSELGFRAPPGTRTRNLRIKSPLLCQIELEAHPPGQPSRSRSRTERKRVTEGT